MKARVKALQVGLNVAFSVGARPTRSHLTDNVVITQSYLGSSAPVKQNNYQNEIVIHKYECLMTATFWASRRQAASMFHEAKRAMWINEAKCP